MSIDKSLKVANSMKRHRSVLSRSERIGALRDEGKWEEGDSIYGLAKVRVQRAKRRTKGPAKEAEAAAVEVTDYVNSWKTKKTGP